MVRSKADRNWAAKPKSSPRPGFLEVIVQTEGEDRIIRNPDGTLFGYIKSLEATDYWFEHEFDSKGRMSDEVGEIRFAYKRGGKSPVRDGVIRKKLLRAPLCIPTLSDASQPAMRLRVLYHGRDRGTGLGYLKAAMPLGQGIEAEFTISYETPAIIEYSESEEGAGLLNSRAA